MWLNLLNAPPAPFVPPAWHGRRICAMAVCYSGDPEGAGEVLAPVLALGDPLFDLLATRPTPRCSRTWTTPSRPASTTTGRPSSWPGWTTACWPRPGSCSPAAPSPGARSGSSIWRAPSTSAPATTAPSATGTPATSSASRACGRPRTRGGDRFRRWIRDAWARLRRFSTGATYVNFQTADEGADRVRAAYGANYDRLVEAKRRGDPGNLFRANRNVVPA